MIDIQALSNQFGEVTDTGFAGVYSVRNPYLALLGAAEVPAGENVNVREVKHRQRIVVDPGHPESFELPPVAVSSTDSRDLSVKTGILQRREENARRLKEELLSGSFSRPVPDGARVATRRLSGQGQATHSGAPKTHSQVLGDVVDSAADYRPITESEVSFHKQASVEGHKSQADHSAIFKAVRPEVARPAQPVSHQVAPKAVEVVFWLNPYEAASHEDMQTMTASFDRVTEQAGEVIVLSFDTRPQRDRPRVPLDCENPIGLMFGDKNVIFIVKQRKPLVDGPVCLFVFDILSCHPVTTAGSGDDCGVMA